ncbi:undecaprenyl-diphosphate phosphatase [Gemmatimonadota bacterium]
MSFWEAVILGFIQGATEFLPVSSSGHLVVGQALLAIEVPGVAFEVAVHVATLLSILLFYRGRIGELVVGAVKGEKASWRYLGLLLLATVPAGVIGLLWQEPIEALFENPMVAGFAFLVTGTFLWSTRRALARNPVGAPGVVAAILIGLAQAIAMVPGISRSGATVTVALWLGLESREAAAFAFLMAIPAIAGAAVLQIGDLQAGTAGIGLPALLAGSVAAAATGVLAIWIFVRMLQRKAFHRFAPYCFALGAVFLAYLMIS